MHTFDKYSSKSGIFCDTFNSMIDAYVLSDNLKFNKYNKYKGSKNFFSYVRVYYNGGGREDLGS